jgi:hypothetical protein
MSAFISKSIYKKRIEICTTCEHFDSKLNRCNLCKCFLLLKAVLKEQKCPERKWPENGL